MKKLLFTQSFLKIDMFFSICKQTIKTNICKTTSFHLYVFTGLLWLYNVYRIILIIQCLQNYLDHTMFTGLSCPECDADLNCVRNRTCSPGEVCMVRNRPLNVNCVKVIYKKTRSCKKKNHYFFKQFLTKFHYFFSRNMTALCRKIRLVLKSSVVKMTSVSLISYLKKAFARIKQNRKKNKA